MAQQVDTLVFVRKRAPAELRFDERLAASSKDRGLTQQALADLVGMQISHIRRYETGQSQPPLNAIRKLAVALSVSADMLLFEKDERGPVIESIVLRNTVKAAERRFTAADAGGNSR